MQLTQTPANAAAKYAPLTTLTNPNNAPAASLLPATGTQPAASAALPAARSDQVSLSDAGRALAQKASQAGEDGEKILGDLTRQTLSALGITSKADALGARIEFDSFSYHAKSSSSLTASHSIYQNSNGTRQETASLQYHQEQLSEVSGKGRIVTADGRSFEFDSQLQVSSSSDFSQSAGVVNNGNGNADNSPNSTTGNGSNIGSGNPVLGGLKIGNGSPLLSVINDILNRIHAANADADTNGTDGTDANTTAAAKPAAATPLQGIAVGEPDPQATRSGAKPAQHGSRWHSHDDNDNSQASRSHAHRAHHGQRADAGSSAGTPTRGVAVGEPDPSAHIDDGTDLFNLRQLQDGAARIARQLDQFGELNAQAAPQVSTAA